VSSILTKGHQMTAQDIAQHIEQTKPDLKAFWVKAESDPHKTLSNLLNEPFSMVQAFKLELLVSYMYTHNRIYFRGSDTLIVQYLNYLKTNNISYYTNLKTINTYVQIDVYKLNAPIESKDFILPNISDINPYINKYLKSKYKQTAPKSTAINFELKDNLMSFTVFKAWLDKQKSINSVQAENFLYKVKFFNTTKVDYVNTILAKCTKPSIKLQRLLTYSSLLEGTNYIGKDRYAIRSIRHKVPYLALPNAMYDERDSDYKPFIAGLYRTPTTNSWEVADLIGQILLLRANTDKQNLPYAQAMIDHLKLPEYQSKLANAKAGIQQTIDVYTQLLKDL
jgi:hypothetical protein